MWSLLLALVPTCKLHPSYLTSTPSLLSLGALDEIINPRIPLRKRKGQSNYRACTRLWVPFVALGENGGERREEQGEEGTKKDPSIAQTCLLNNHRHPIQIKPHPLSTAGSSLRRCASQISSLSQCHKDRLSWRLVNQHKISLCLCTENPQPLLTGSPLSPGSPRCPACPGSPVKPLNHKGKNEK